jgi:cardiolipin synthase
LNWTLLVELVVLVAHVTGLVSAAHAIWYGRSSQGAIAWAITLAMFPYLAVPFYWIFGRRRFFGYREALRRVAREHHPHLLQELARLRDSGEEPAGDRAQDLRVLAKLAGQPWTGHNRLELLVDGPAAFAAFAAALESARDYALVQFYILRDDETGRHFAAALAATAARGVRVSLLYDEVGCFQLPARYLRDLSRAGVSVSAFRTRRGPGNRFQINFRNHRKILVVDGRLGLLGGLNVGDEYRDGGGRFSAWRDTHLRVEGPAALALEAVFLADWYWATRETPPVRGVAEKAAEGTSRTLVFASGPIDDDNRCEQFLVALIGTARERVWIASPYLVPPPSVVTALLLAERRGVDVRLLLPEHRDHFFVNMAGHAFIPELVRGGARVFAYHQGFMHQKVWLIDRDLASVGTLNLDNRSIFLNFEVTLLARDPDFAARVEAMFEADFSRSRVVSAQDLDRRSLWFRFWVKFSRLLEPVL